MVDIVWLQGATDNGCLISFLNAQQPGVYDAIEKLGVNIGYQNTLSPQSGPKLLEVLNSYENSDKDIDVLIIEGAVPQGPNGTGGACLIGSKTFKDWLEVLAPKAQYIIALGTCASFGGIPAAPPNPTDCTGVQWDKKEFGGFLGKDFKSKAGLPVVNISGCPAHPDWVIQTLVALLQIGRAHV